MKYILFILVFISCDNTLMYSSNQKVTSDIVYVGEKQLTSSYGSISKLTISVPEYMKVITLNDYKHHDKKILFVEPMMFNDTLF